MIEKFIRFQEKFKSKILGNYLLNQRLEKIYNLSFVGAFLMYYLISTFKIDLRFVYVIYHSLAIISISVFMMLYFRYVQDSIKSFLIIGTVATITIGIAFWIINYQFIPWNYFSYTLTVVIMTIFWTFLSGLSELKVAIISNAILAVILNIILQINSFVWKILQANNINIGISESIENLNISQYEYMDLAINLALSPMLVMVTIGALFCAYKEYFYKEDPEIQEKKN